jgi:glycosyltransferase involved in cell wall biosynthesis
MGTKRKLNFLLVTGIYPPDIGGPATFIPLFEKYLTQNEIQYKTITLADQTNSKNELESRNLIKIRRSRAKLSRFWRVIREVVREGRSSEFIFVNGLHEEAGIALLVLRKKKAIAKIVGDPVWERAKNAGKTSLTVQEFNKSKNLNWRAVLQRKLLKFCLNRFDSITCPSQELVEIVKAWGVRIPVVLIQNGVEVRPYKRNHLIWDIVSVSRLVKWKNIEKLIEFADVCGFSLAVVGSGPEENYLRSVAAGSKNVVFLGDLDREAVKNVLAASRFFGLFSDYEGLSFSLLESMSFGVIPIVNSNPGNLAVVSDGENGFVITLEGIQESAQKVLQVSADQTNIDRLSQTAYRNCKENFDIQKKLDELLRNFLHEI